MGNMSKYEGHVSEGSRFTTKLYDTCMDIHTCTCIHVLITWDHGDGLKSYHFYIEKFIGCVHLV